MRSALRRLFGITPRPPARDGQPEPAEAGEVGAGTPQLVAPHPYDDETVAAAGAALDGSGGVVAGRPAHEVVIAAATVDALDAERDEVSLHAAQRVQALVSQRAWALAWCRYSIDAAIHLDQLAAVGWEMKVAVTELARVVAEQSRHDPIGAMGEAVALLELCVVAEFDANTQAATRPS